MGLRMHGFLPVLAGLLLVPGKGRPVLVEFRSSFEKAKLEAVHRNIPLLFVIGKDH